MIRKYLSKLLFERKKCWNYYKLYEHITKWLRLGSYPNIVELPDEIVLNSDFWQKAKELNGLTIADEHERAVGVWWVDSDICFTPNQRGERESVTQKYSLTVSYTPHTDDTYITKQVSFDRKIILSKSVSESQIPKVSTIAPLFNLHTHPPYYVTNASKKERKYSFFSKTDIESLLAGQSIISGVITDQVYLLVKTEQMPRYVPVEVADEHITPEFLWNVMKLVQYKGSWSTATLEKVNFP